MHPAIAARRRPATGFRARLLPLLALLLLVGLLPATAAAQGPVPDDVAAKLQAAIDRPVERLPLAGITAAVILPDGSTWTGATGWADIGRRIPMRPATPIVIGSITKTYVAATILQLAEEGKLGLDDRLSRFLPDYPRAARYTIRQLLSHSSGLFDYFEAPAYESRVFDRPRHRWTVGEILGLVGHPTFKPGARYGYSNTNYVLLGKVIRRITGKPVSAEIRRRFLVPLGLAHTVLQGEQRIPFVAAQGYLWAGGRWHGLADGTRFRPNTSAATVANSAGAMLATAEDVARWGRALYGGSVLAPESLAAMETVLPKEPYGLGVRRFDLPGGVVAWGHTGSLRGYVSYLWHLPAENVTVVLVTNRGRVNLTYVVRRLASIALRASGSPALD